MSETGAVLDFGSMTPTLEAPPEETTAPVAEETPVETPTETPEETPGQGAPEAPPEGKPTSLKAIRDAVKAFESTNPEHAKALKSLLDNEGRIRAYQETYPDVETARSVKAAIEAVGGLEGITELSRLRDAVEETDSMIEAGDPEVIERIFSDAKEGGVKLLPHYMNRVEKENPQAFGESIRPHLVRSLEAANFLGAVNSLSRLIADKPEAKEIVDSMVAWFNGEKQKAEKSNLDALQPERNKLKDEWGKVTTEKQRIFEEDVNRDVKPVLNQTFSQHMRSYLQNDTRPDAAKQDIARAWLRELGEAMKNDQKQIAQMMKSKNPNKQAVVNFAKTRIAAVAKGVTDKIVAQYKLTPNGKPAAKPKPGEQPTVSTTAIKVTQKPSDEQIDWDKDPDRMLFITGKAYLKGSGKLVKWR
jgi:hypothetical protein